MSSQQVAELAEEIQRLAADADGGDRQQARAAFARLRAELSAGRVRAAEPDASTPTGWRVNAWVKQGILLGFRSGGIIPFPSTSPDQPYLDKDTLPLRPLDPHPRCGLYRAAPPFATGRT